MAIVEFENVTRIYTAGDHELRALEGRAFPSTRGNSSSFSARRGRESRRF